jgi:3-oxoadipate enol-lactonase
MFVETGEVAIFCVEEGVGEPLVLIHGLGMSHELWEQQLPEFSKNFRTIAVDLRGFGRSSCPSDSGSYAIEKLASDIACVIESLGIKPCHILGTSMGGFVAQMLVLDYPALCRSLILCHTAPRMSIPLEIVQSRVESLSAMRMEEYSAIVVEQAFSCKAGDDARGFIAKLIAKNNKEVYTQVLVEGLTGFDVTGRLSDINKPTLVITGEFDRVLPKDGGQEICDLIPRARYYEVSEVGHLGYIEKPDQFNRIVIEFLNSIATDIA